MTIDEQLETMRPLLERLVEVRRVITPQIKAVSEELAAVKTEDEFDHVQQKLSSLYDVINDAKQPLISIIHTIGKP
jgi:ribose 1,5-bisphosphokinase PhnN